MLRNLLESIALRLAFRRARLTDTFYRDMTANPDMRIPYLVAPERIDRHTPRMLNVPQR
jgi:hypothetical protein